MPGRCMGIGVARQQEYLEKQECAGKDRKRESFHSTCRWLRSKRRRSWSVGRSLRRPSARGLGNPIDAISVLFKVRSDSFNRVSALRVNTDSLILPATLPWIHRRPGGQPNLEMTVL